MLYEYKCTDKKCKHVFEVIVDSRDEKVACEKCEAPARRVRISLATHVCRSSWPVK